MLYDSLIKNLISGTYDEHKDVLYYGIPEDVRDAFCDDVKTVILMPAAFCFGGEDDFCDIRNYPASFSILKRLRTVFADVRFMADEGFRRALTENGFSRIAVIFAECADISEYGYRQTYGWVGEYRAERQDFVQIVCFVAPGFPEPQRLFPVFGITDAYVTGNNELPAFSVFETVSSNAKLYAAAASAEKYAFDRTVVCFNSREEAGRFRAFLNKRATACLYLDGAVTATQRLSVLTQFMTDSTNLLITTKAYIPSSFFCVPERVIFCGVPFSQSHLYRSICVCKKHPPSVIYCEEDIRRNERIISSLSEAFSDRSIRKKRLKGLYDMKNLLKSNQ